MKQFATKKAKFQPDDQPTPGWMIQRINEAAQERNRAEGPRKYLGASIIGDKCTRELWYNFRWVAQEDHDGQMVRLFERGHREEEIIRELLVRDLGLEVQHVDPKTGKQYRHSDVGGHFGGGRDGRARWGPAYRWFLVEYKTYNKQRFNRLELLDSIKKESPKYHGQMQVYLNAEDLPYCLFVAMCKDDDRLYIEWVRTDKVQASQLLERAEFVIGSQTPPDRLTNDPTDNRCRFCIFHQHCHGKKAADKNCRSCSWAEPIDDGEWRCNHPNHEFGEPCADWTDITK